MNIWRDGILSDLVTLQRGFDITKSQQKPGSVPVISSSGIGSYHNDYKVAGPGVVIGRKGTLGTVFFSEENFWPHDTTLWVKDFHGNDPKYCYYFLKSLHFEKFDVGAANPTLNRNHIHLVPIKIPPIEIQKKIAFTLSKFDSLISINTFQLENLKKIAEVLYNEWFVHYRFPKYEEVKMTDSGHSDFGSIPDGCFLKTLGEIVRIRKGKNITSNSVCPGKVPVVAGGLEPAYYHNVANTVCPVITVSASGANAGYVNFYGENVWASDCSVIDASVTSTPHYFYLLLKNKQRDITRLQRGSAQPHVYPTDLEALEIIGFPEEIISKFEILVKPIFSLIFNLRSQNITLTNMRNLLLPKFLSGEIDVLEVMNTGIEKSISSSSSCLASERTFV